MLLLFCCCLAACKGLLGVGFPPKFNLSFGVCGGAEGGRVFGLFFVCLVGVLVLVIDAMRLKICEVQLRIPHRGYAPMKLFLSKLLL
jgi:hypothetical protein